MEEQTQNTNQEIKESAPAIEQNKDKKKPLGRKIIWGIVILILFILAIQIAVADRYSAQVQVIEGEKKVGVNPTTEKLDFGDLSADTTATRFVTLNAGGMDTFVHITKIGGVGELIKVSENNFTMKSGDEKKIEFTMYMPPSAPVGTWYKGYVMIFKIPKIW